MRKASRNENGGKAARFSTDWKGVATSSTNSTTLIVPIPLARPEHLELADQLYREFHTRCFWHSPRDLIITEDLVPFVVNGLRAHGGRRGFI
jgi:hypothetical protein